MHYYNTPGRVSIDLLKVVRANYSLEKYTLDFVSSHFHQNDILEVGGNYFKTNDVSGLAPGIFLNIKKLDVISNTEEFLGQKVKISRIDTEDKKIFFEARFEIKDFSNTPGVRFKWCLAKDDISPSQIFEYFGLDSYHRSLVGKYCIQDCVLVNKMMEKLDVISNSIAMANVCKVPLNFIFTRGQGIKAYSLIKSKANERGYLFPTKQKSDVVDKVFELKEHEREELPTKKIEKCSNEFCESKKNLHIPKKVFVIKKSEWDTIYVCVTCSRVQFDTSFEGAHVKDPIPGYYTEPIIVMDFASLYPNSIIQKNMSGETQILEDCYDNLEGHKHYDIEYSTDYGKRKCRFVKTDEKHLGIIPETLKYLLETRAKIKKKMKKETNPFRKRILDGQQFAMKITTNSTSFPFTLPVIAFNGLPERCATDATPGRLLSTHVAI